MKYSSLMIFIALLLMQSCKKEGYTLDGQLKGITNGVKVALKPFAMYDIPVESEFIQSQTKLSQSS